MALTNMPLIARVKFMEKNNNSNSNNNSNNNRNRNMKNNNNINLVAFALIAMVIIGSIMVECASSVPDYEYMDAVRDIIDQIQQNANRLKKSPKADKGQQSLRMRFGRRSDPWMMPGPVPLNGVILGSNTYYGADQA